MGADVVVDPKAKSPYETWTEMAKDPNAAAAAPGFMSGMALKPAVIFEAVGVPGVIEQIMMEHARGVPFTQLANITGVPAMSVPLCSFDEGLPLGMQLMAERGREYVVTPGLGWIAGEVDRIVPSDPHLKIPHMGWNTLNEVRPHPLLAGIDLGPQGRHAYFVHSYQLKPDHRADLVAEADYGGPITAVVARDTFAGTQFHPEKSQRLGLALIANFLKWTP